MSKEDSCVLLFDCEVNEILYDYLDKVITQKQVYEYLLNYGYSKKQIKDFIKETRKKGIK